MSGCEAELNPGSYYDQPEPCFEDGAVLIDGQWYCEPHGRRVMALLRLAGELPDDL